MRPLPPSYDNGGVHIYNGIPNRAFYGAAQRLGGHTWEHVGVIWYAALRGLSATRAATVQLAVPALAALAGVLFLSEPLTPRLVQAAVLILGGVGLAVLARSRPVQARGKA